MTGTSLALQPVVPPMGINAKPFPMPRGTLGMWTFLIGDAATFATLLVTCGLLRTWSQDWPVPVEVLNLRDAGIMTGLLLASSVAMAFSLTALRQGKQPRFAVSLLLTIVGGSAFLLLQAWEWSHLINQGVTLTQNPWGARLFGASFFVLTGFHGCHVIIGIVYLTVILIKGLNGRYHPQHINPVAIAGLYWYFVDVSWLFVLFVVYLL